MWVTSFMWKPQCFYSIKTQLAFAYGMTYCESTREQVGEKKIEEEMTRSVNIFGFVWFDPLTSSGDSEPEGPPPLTIFVYCRFPFFTRIMMRGPPYYPKHSSVNLNCRLASVIVVSLCRRTLTKSRAP